MWTCGLLKANARNALSGRYWKCFLVCLVAGLLGASNAIKNVFSLNYSINDTVSNYNQPDVWTGNNNYNSVLDSILSSGLVAALLGVAFLFFILSLCWDIFLAQPVAVGLNRYFMESRQGSSPFGTLFSTLRPPYLNVVKVLFLTNLKIALGSLLIIPGIYWAYCYRLVPYLLAENPYMTTSRAMELSRQMMYGEKWHSFVLELSFIGWDLLCALTLGIGFLFLEPYVQATFAELYAALRSKAFASGMTNSNELGGFLRY